MRHTPQKGPRSYDYITDEQRRESTATRRRKSLIKKAHQLISLCGGKLFLRYIPENEKSYVYTNDDNAWQEYRTQGLQPMETMVKSNVGSEERCYEDGKLWHFVKGRDKKITVKRTLKYPSPVKCGSTSLDSNFVISLLGMFSLHIF